MSGEKDHTYLQARMFLLLSVNCQFLQNQQFHVSRWSDSNSYCGWGNEHLTLITSSDQHQGGAIISAWRMTRAILSKDTKLEKDYKDPGSFLPY